jgi:hypothetical protein
MADETREIVKINIDDEIDIPDDELEMDLQQSIEDTLREIEGDDYVEEEEVTTSDYYGIETVKKKKKRKVEKKIEIKSTDQRRNVKKYKQVNLARFSNIYMIAGIIIGAALFYFLMAPAMKKDFNEKLRETETNYNKTLSTKNSEIENLSLELKSVDSRNSDLETQAAELQGEVENLTKEVETLKTTVEKSGVSLTTEEETTEQQDEAGEGDTDNPDEEGETTEEATTEANTNAAADRNNANVTGISGSEIEGIISNE